MNKKISLGAAVAFMLIVATATFSMTMIYSANKFNETSRALKEREAQFEKFGEIDRLVRQKYYGTINETFLMDSVASGYVAGLGDENATYIDARAYEKLLRDQQGTLVGIGAVIEISPDGYLAVTEVYNSSPAQAEGMEVGDQIVRVDDTNVTTENSQQMLEAIQGESGTRVTLMVRRGSEETLMEIPRRLVAVPTVYGSILEGTTIGYLYITEINDNTSQQFSSEVDTLIKAGAKSLIFDLRDNSGRSLRQAIRMLDKLMAAQDVIVSYTPKDSEPQLYGTDTNEIELPLVVLVNENTASAAEVFAFVLQDYGKAMVVGATTMGQGSVQEVVQLNDGSALMITVAELELGKEGTVIDKIGVKPDFETALEGDAHWRDLPKEYDTQLLKAQEVAQGLVRTSDTGTEEGQSTVESQSDPEQTGDDSPEPDDGSVDGNDSTDDSTSNDDDASSQNEALEETQLD